MSTLLQAAADLNPSKVMRKVAAELSAYCGHVPANQLTPMHVDALTRNWRERLKPWSRRTYTTPLRKLLRHIAAVANQPEIKIKTPQRGLPRMRTATEEERTRLWAAASPALKFCLLCWTELGLRFIEPLRICPEDIDEKKRTVSLIAKGEKRRELPIPQKLEELLAALGPFAEGVPLITQILGKPTNPANTIRREWDLTTKKVGIPPDLHIHDLRRTLATTLYRATLDPLLVQQALGHENLGTTTSYLAPHEPAHLRATLESIQWRWKQ
ncbi:MAG: site-specific integrase [Candidatus Acidiferrales bacterium]